MENFFESSIPASLAKRLGEAADGYRNVGKIYFVAGYKKPHMIKVFFGLKEAKEFMSTQPPDKFEIFGPFETTDELNTSNLAGAEDIKSIEVRIKYKDGYEHKETVPPDTDSIFLNLASFDKFVFPYYCNLYGANYVKKLRDKVLSKYKENTQEDNDDKEKKSLFHPHVAGTLIWGINNDETWED
jgi:hypothetical protein